MRQSASSWLPGVSAVCATAVTLSFFGVPMASTAVFLGYLLLEIVLPGTLLWRLLRRGGRSFVEDVAAGTALGYAVEVATYIPGRAVGVPLLVLVPPAATIAAFAFVPGLRRYWHGEPGERAPVSWSWAMAGIWVMILAWAVKSFRFHGMRWPGYGSPDIDMPFHLALVGEAKHHLPLMIPWVSGEPLLYHWFVYAQLASTSWVTGIEPMVLLTRLSMLPMVAAFVVLIAALARRLTGHWWAGAVAAASTFFVLAPNPYGWNLAEFYRYHAFGAFEDGSVLRFHLWMSVTQTFGALLFASVMVVSVDLLTGQGRDRRQWILFTGLLVTVMGAKATYLPILFAALSLVLAVGLVVRRRVHRPALGATAVTSVLLVFAQLVLFGSAPQGLQLRPLGIVRMIGAPPTTGFTTQGDRWRLILMAVITMFCWLCIWAGVVGLRRRLLMPEITLLLGVGLAGMAAVLAFSHSGISQTFFLMSARPYLAVAAVCGLVALVPRPDRRKRFALLAAVVAGFGAAGAGRMLTGTTVPVLTPTRGPKQVAFALTWPYALLLGVVLVVGLGLWLARRRIPAGTAVALTVCLVAGFGLLPTCVQYSTLFREAAARGWREAVIQPPIVTRGTMEAGRWLRDHSGPDDLVATNAHCLPPPETNRCLDIHFSVAAYTERRVLVEGWGFTATAHAEEARQHVSAAHVRYWKPEVLADNDAAFSSPSRRTIATLRDRYRVRWLFVDETVSVPPGAIADYAALRYRSGACAVYEVKP
jgi:hypothetical protein